MRRAAIPIGNRYRRLLHLLLAVLVCWLLVAAPGLAAQENPAPAANTQEHVPAVKPAGELAQTTSLFLAMLKALGALALVLGLIALLTVWLRKMGWGKDAPSRNGSLIRVLDTRMLAPKKFVAVVRIADEFIAVGITDQQINLLTRLEPNEKLIASLTTGPRSGAPALGSFAAILTRMRKSGTNDDSSQSC